MKDTKRNFLEQVDEYFNQSLDEVALNLEKIGSRRTEPTLNQHAFRAEVCLDEVIHLKPTNPKFKAGTLLTSPEGIDDSYDSQMGMLKCASSDNEEAYIDLGVTKEIFELGEQRRVLTAETIMVTDESIQIRKHTVLKAAENLEKIFQKKRVYYTIRHVLHVLDNKTKVMVPTKLFKEDDGRFSSDLVMYDSLDCNFIMRLYETAKPEDIVKPLTIFKK